MKKTLLTLIAIMVMLTVLNAKERDIMDTKILVCVSPISEQSVTIMQIPGEEWADQMMEDLTQSLKALGFIIILDNSDSSTFDNFSPRTQKTDKIIIFGPDPSSGKGKKVVLSQKNGGKYVMLPKEFNPRLFAETLL